MRANGKKVLCLQLKSQSEVSTLEEEVFQISKGDQELYNRLIFEVLFDLQKTIESVPQVLERLRAGKYLFRHPNLSETLARQQEEEHFIEKPFEVEEGVLTCPKCKGSKTFSYAKQTRSADEPMTTFATCMLCKWKWTYSG